MDRLEKERAKSAGRWEQDRSQLGLRLIGVLYLSFKAWVVGRFWRFECLRMICNLFGILKVFFGIFSCFARV